MRLNKLVAILSCLFVYLVFNIVSCHEVISEQVVEDVPKHRLNLGYVSNMKSVIGKTGNYLRQKLAQFYERFDGARAATFGEFIKLYNKHYSASELPRRMKLFSDWKKQIDESQLLFEQGKAPFEMKLNKFADLDENEIRSSVSGLKRPSNEILEEVIEGESDDDSVQFDQAQEVADENGVKESQSGKPEDNLTRSLSQIPSSKDWRETGCISDPVDQQNCGSCYAISTMSLVDSMLCLRGFTEKPHNLSAQQIVDCAKDNYFNDDYYNEGCKNGWPSSVLHYLQEEGVALKEKCYPYANMENTDCLSKRLMKKRGCTVEVNISGKKLPYKVIQGERSILYHVAETGPVVVTIFATRKFRLYSTGIFEDDECNDENAENNLGTHAILIVGYGQEKGVDYWIIKNSWGVEEWGEGGYGRIRRGGNTCNIGSIGWVVTL